MPTPNTTQDDSSAQEDEGTSLSLLTLPAEIRRKILRELLDLNQATPRWTIDWKPMDSPSVWGIPSETKEIDEDHIQNRIRENWKIEEHYHYTPDADEKEEDPGLWLPDCPTTRPTRLRFDPPPAGAYAMNASVGPDFRSRRLHLEVIYTCRQLYTEGTWILQQNRLICVDYRTTNVGLKHWNSGMYRRFPIWSKSTGDNGTTGPLTIPLFDYPVYIRRAMGNEVHARRSKTVLIAPRDLPRFIKFAHIMDAEIGHPQTNEHTADQTPTILVFPKSTSARHWGFAGEESFLRFLSASMCQDARSWWFTEESSVLRLFSMGTPEATTLAAPVPAFNPTASSTWSVTDTGEESENAGAKLRDVRGQLEQWMSTIHGTSSRPMHVRHEEYVGDVNELPDSHIRGTVLAIPPLFSSLLEEGDALVQDNAIPMEEILFSFYRLKHMSFRRAVFYYDSGMTDKMWATYSWCCFRLATTDEIPETEPDRSNRLRWTHRHATDALALPTFISTQREWEARLRLRRAEVKVLLRANDEAVLDELFYVTMAATPHAHCPPSVSHFAHRQWARAFVRGSGKESTGPRGLNAKVCRVRALVNETFGEEVQRTQEIVYPRHTWYTRSFPSLAIG